MSLTGLLIQRKNTLSSSTTRTANKESEHEMVNVDIDLFRVVLPQSLLTD